MSDPIQLPQWNRRVTDRAPDEVADVLKRMADSIRRGRWLFLTVFLASAAVVQIVAFAWPGTFAAQASLLIEKTRQTIRLDADPSEPAMTIAQGVSTEELNSEIAVLTSAEVLTETMRNTGLDRVPEPWYVRTLFAPLRGYESAYARWHGVPAPSQADRTLRALGQAISATAIKDSNVLVVTYEGGDPRGAELVLNELLVRYLDRHLEVHRPKDAQGFFAGQAALVSDELRGYEEQLRQLKVQMSVSEASSERDAALELDATLREEQSALLRRRAEINASIAAYERRAGLGFDRLMTTSRQDTSTLEALKAQLIDLELEQVNLDARFLSHTPQVLEHQKKVGAARHALEQERAQLSETSSFTTTPVAITIDQELARLTAEREGAVARLEAVGSQLVASRTRLIKLDETVTEATRIERLIRMSEQRYLMYLDRQDKARVDGALDHGRFTNVSVVQHASASPRPVRPRKLVTLLMAVFGGLIVAFITCVWLELSSIRPGRLLASAAPRPAEV